MLKFSMLQRRKIFRISIVYTETEKEICRLCTKSRSVYSDKKACFKSWYNTSCLPQDLNRLTRLKKHGMNI